MRVLLCKILQLCILQKTVSNQWIKHYLAIQIKQSSHMTNVSSLWKFSNSMTAFWLYADCLTRLIRGCPTILAIKSWHRSKWEATRQDKKLQAYDLWGCKQSKKSNKIQTQDPDTLTNQQWLWFASEKRAQLFMSFLSSHGQGTHRGPE